MTLLPRMVVAIGMPGRFSELEQLVSKTEAVDLDVGQDHRALGCS